MKPPKGVPRDEWLLAIGLANHRGLHRVGLDVADAICPNSDSRDTRAAAWNGAATVRGYNDWDFDHEDPDAFAAGAALVMALEEP